MCPLQKTKHGNQCGKQDSSEYRRGVNGANLYVKSLLRDKESKTLRRRTVCIRSITEP